MRMRNALHRILLVGAVAATTLLAVSVAAPEPAGAAPKLRCAGGKTVVRTKALRIFTKVNRETSHPDYYGCLYRKRTAFRLNVRDDYGVSVDRRRLLISGRYVALVQHLGSGAGSDTDIVIVTDLATGRALEGPGSTNEGDSVLDLVLKANGSAAFILEREVPGGLEHEVFIITPAGSRLVDQGLDIDPESLKLSPDGRLVTYSKAGVRVIVEF